MLPLCLYKTKDLHKDCQAYPCLPGLPSVLLGVLLVTMVQVVGVSVIAVVIPRLYDRDWGKIMEEGDVAERRNLAVPDELEPEDNR